MTRIRRRRADGHVLRALAVLALCCGSCAGPVHEGPQITDRPDGFAYEPDAHAARQVLPERETVRQLGYFTLSEPSSSIIISEYRGPTTRQQAEASRAAAADKWTYQHYGAIEDLTIDGRAAWGWEIEQRSRGETTSLEYVAVVAYTDRTYTIEFHAAETKLRKPALLRRTVESFRVVGSRTFNLANLLALVAFAAGAVLLTRKLKALERRERWSR